MDKCRAVIIEDILLFSLNLFKPLAIQESFDIKIPLQKDVIKFIEFLREIKLKIEEKKYKQYSLYYLNDIFVIPCINLENNKNDKNYDIEAQLVSFLSVLDKNNMFSAIGNMKQYSNIITDYMLIAYSKFHKVTNDLKRSKL